MFNNILLTIDLTEDASWKKALPQAVEMARASNGTLHIVTVVPDYGMPLVSGFFPEDHREKSLAEAKKLLKVIVDENVPDDIKSDAHVRYGPLHEKVMDTIDRVKPDLVVMASHRPNKMREFFVGTQADRVVRHSPVSVLVVRA